MSAIQKPKKRTIRSIPQKRATMAERDPKERAKNFEEVACGFKLGGRHLFTSIGASYQPGDALAGTGPNRFERGTRRWGPTLGVGWRFGLHAGIFYVT